MDTIVVCATVVAAVVVAAATFWLWHSYQWRALQRRRVVIVVEVGPGEQRTVSGILWERRGPLYVLRDAYVLALREGDAPRAMDGELVVERGRVVWVQVVT